MRKRIIASSHLHVLALTFCLCACQRQMISKNDISADGAEAAVPSTAAGPGIFDRYTATVNKLVQ